MLAEWQNWTLITLWTRVRILPTNYTFQIESVHLKMKLSAKDEYATFLLHLFITHCACELGRSRILLENQ